ncbi:hypothetical protein M9434_002522 [Picochlorum sp. BPE23]|nr:hypothetical protein M9434_002522 [Picochlorum sp. BPE23]
MLRFSPAAFFYALLPPIVFAAGFTLKKRSFFDNIGAILTYAVLGTVISAVTFGLGTYILVLLHIISPTSMGAAPFAECFMYGAAISSIDPVATLAVLAQSNTPPILYNLVFGESVLNDAVAIVLFHSIESSLGSSFSVGTIPAVFFQFWFLLVGSLIVGTGVALACAFLLKRFNEYYSNPDHWTKSGYQASTDGVSVSENQEHHKEQSIDPTVYEMSIVIMGSYLAYLVAEVAGTSGIVALFFSGIYHSHYSYYNISDEAQVSVRRLFEVGAFLCELFVFAYLGLQVATMSHSLDFGLLLSGIPFAIGSRLAMIIPCTILINRYRKNKLPVNMMKMMWAVGLRGAVAYGLVVNMPSGEEKEDGAEGIGIPAIETATLLIAVTSSLALGSTTGPLLRYLDLEGKSDAEIYTQGWQDARPDSLQTQSDAQFETKSSWKIHQRFKEFDNSMLKPIFGGRVHPEEEVCLSETEILRASA